jgi:hypothetical protein
MKTMKKLLFSALVLIFCAGIAPSASGKDLQKTFTWKYTINKDGSIVVDNYDCNLTIHTWDKGETEYHLTVDAKTHTDDDADILDKFLTNMKFSNTPGSVTFRDNFWENRSNILGRMTMKLEGGKEIVLSGFSIKGELWIPAGCKIELNSKYSEIRMEDFAGLLTIDLYNGNLYGGNLMNKARIVDKYSTIEFSDIKDLSADLYNSKLEAKNAGDLNIDSKYSKVTAISAGKLEINSYNDKYSIPKTGDIIFISKYSDLKTESSGQLKIDSYEGSFIMNDVKDIKIESKYTDFQFGTAGDISIPSVYNGKLVAGVVKSLSINESKYCNYQIDELKSSVTETDGYQDKFTILKTTGDLKEVRLNGKYLEISLGLLKSTDYRFKAKINYPKLDMNESQLKTKVKISDGSQLEYDAVKGTEKEGMPLIELSGYNMSLKIIEI